MSYALCNATYLRHITRRGYDTVGRSSSSSSSIGSSIPLLLLLLSQLLLHPLTDRLVVTLPKAEEPHTLEAARCYSKNRGGAGSWTCCCCCCP
jgi:hypothetical protein